MSLDVSYTQVLVYYRNQENIIMLMIKYDQPL